MFGERPEVDAEDIVDLKVPPELGQLVGDGPKRSRPGREKDRVDRASRHTRDDGESRLRQMPRDAPENADLIGRSRPAARQDDRQISPR
jgi:hypothetical protein